MIAVLKQGSSQSDIKTILEKLWSGRTRKGVDAHKYCGVLKLKQDALKIQKQLRDEWE